MEAIREVPISSITENPDNPRKIDRQSLDQLKQSIESFPEMLRLRPIVVNDQNIIIGGNMRYKACKALKRKTVFVISASDLTPEQQKQFMIRDNVSAGSWDWDLMEEWDQDQLVGWGVENPSLQQSLKSNVSSDPEFEREVKKFTNENAEKPIVPDMHEKYSYFIIMTKNEIDEQFLRNHMQLHQRHHSSSKGTDPRLSNVIPFETIRDICLKAQESK